MSRLSDLADAQELTINLALRELRSKYKRSLLGWTWSLLNPLATVAIYSVVFRFFLKIPVPIGDPSGAENFALFLLTGLVLWNFFGNGLSQGMTSLVANENLIKKVWFRREALVVASVGSWGVSLVIETAVLMVLYLLIGNMTLPMLPLMALLLVLLAVFVLGIALMLSVVNVYFRDMEHLLTLLLQAWFYATPIVYPITLVPEEAVLFGRTIPLIELYRLNPMTRFIEVARDMLYDVQVPTLASFAYLVAAAGVSLAVGLAVFRRHEGRLAEEL